MTERPTISFTVPGDVAPAQESDHVRALRYAEALFGADEYRSFVIDGNPCSKARHRFGRNGAVYAPSRKAEKALSWIIKQSFREPMVGNVFVICIFFRDTFHRIDSDNLMKHFLDAATGVCWIDDSQVTAQLGVIEYDKARPRTVALIGEHKSTMIRQAVKIFTCAGCGTAFRSEQASPKFCSRKCASHSIGQNLTEKIPCAQCGEMFKRRSYPQRFCGEPCRMEAMLARQRAQFPKKYCSCGAVLSKPGYTQCRSCWLSGSGSEGAA